MKLYRSFKNINTIKNSVVSIGMFDGVNLGHTSVINRVIEIAKEKNIKSIIITFSNSPVSYFSKDIIDLQITNSKEKIALFRKTQLDYLFVIEFNEYIANLIPFDFINDILISLFNVKYMVFGYDNHFGKNREGSFEHLKHYGPSYGFEVEEIPKQDINDVGVSSTKIRNSLLEGNISLANDCLGYSYVLTGNVIKGNQLGRTIGFPTANVEIPEDYKLIPKNGQQSAESKAYDKVASAKADVDAILEDTRQMEESPEKIEKFRIFAQEIKKDVPAVFLYSPNFIYVVPEKLQGVVPKNIETPSERFLSVYNWYLETDTVWRIFN